MTVEKVDALTEAFCHHCGSGWFEIASEDMDPDQYVGTGGIKFSGDGRIIAYSGTVICFECGEPVAFPMASSIPSGVGPEEISDLDLPPMVTFDPRAEQYGNPVTSARPPGCETKRDRAAPD